MSDIENFSSVGRSTLKDILIVRDLLDYRAALEKKDNSPLSEETIRNIKAPDKGWVFAVGALVDRFNQSPADAAAAAKLFGLDLDPANPRLKASQFSGTVLNQLDSAADLKTALARLDSREAKTISRSGQALLKQILFIRDFLDYFKFLLTGDKKNGRPSPLSPELLNGFRDLKKGPETFGQLVKQFNADPNDVRLALKLFGLEPKADSPVKARDFAFAGALFRITEHSALLKKNLCLIDKAACPAEQPMPVKPAPAPPVIIAAPPSPPATEPAKGELEQLSARTLSTPSVASQAHAQKPLPTGDNGPGKVATALAKMLLTSFKDHKNDPRVKNMEETRVSFSVAAKPESDLSAVTFTATITVPAYESDVLTVIKPCSITYALKPDSSLDLRGYIKNVALAAYAKPLFRQP